MTTKRETPNKPERPQRTPVHEQRDKITVKTNDPDHVYRWVNATDPERVLKFQRGGYEFAPGDTVIGDKAVEDQITRTSSVIERYMGQGQRAVLMRIRRDWYEQDQLAKQAEVDELERAMKREAMEDRYGKFTVQQSKR